MGSFLPQVTVLDVKRQADGSVVHVAAAPLPPGTSVTAEVDWRRRFDLMQQHTGAWQGSVCAALDILGWARFGSGKAGMGCAEVPP